MISALGCTPLIRFNSLLVLIVVVDTGYVKTRLVNPHTGIEMLKVRKYKGVRDKLPCSFVFRNFSIFD